MSHDVEGGSTWAALGVHLLTASGVAPALLAAWEIAAPIPEARRVFLWLAMAVIIDAVDGPLARLFHVKTRLPQIDGRKIDDIVDYLTFTFLPLLLVWKSGWLPAGWGGWLVAPAMIASLFGFASSAAKQEQEGFFAGFPSYWNIYAFYAGLIALRFGAWPNAVLLIALTVLTVAPVRFIYPNLAPHPWRWPMLAAAGAWLIGIVWMLTRYPHVSDAAFWGSLIYPAIYVALSIHLDMAARKRRPSISV